MQIYDEKVLQCFLEQQLKLFPEAVAETPEEAEDFLEECLAVVVDNLKEVWKYFEDAGVDIAELSMEDIEEADEVFPVGDGRYLIVEA
ncbi:MAG: glyoxalase [Lachnospiraceae bacterium]|nr:glyoxalase [Lachnospiraceae bacterium]MBQ8261451.1 glyoxalase [Lachnospiraceae bacterium]